MIGKPLQAVPIWLALVLVACASDHEGARVVRQDSLGVTLIDYPSLPTSPDRIWVLPPDPDLMIGAVEGEAPFLFTFVRAAATFTDGSVLIADAPLAGAPQELRFFSRDGQYIRTIGRLGQGPGEFQALRAIRIAPGDTILTWDNVQRRLTVFAPTGAVIRTVHPKDTQGSFPGPLLDLWADGSLLVALRGGGPSPMPNSVYHDTVTLGRMIGADPAPVVTLARIPVAGDYVHGDGQRTLIPFAARPIQAIGGAYLCVSSGESFSFVCYHEGEMALRLQVNVPPVPISDADMQAYMERQFGTLPAAQRALRERLVAEVPVPRALPALDRLLISKEGDVWVRRYALEKDPVQNWHVFDATGEYVAAVELPTGLELLEASRSVVLLRATDNLGTHRLHRYALQGG